MGKIFNNATVTIAASGATNPEGGCFQAGKPLTYMSCKVAGYGNNQIWIERHSDKYFQAAQSTLARRGWCHQEQVLSRRILYFGRNRMSWQCTMGTAQEDDYFGTVMMSNEIVRKILWTSFNHIGINDDSYFPDADTEFPSEKISIGEYRPCLGLRSLTLTSKLRECSSAQPVAKPSSFSL